MDRNGNRVAFSRALLVDDPLSPQVFLGHYFAWLKLRVLLFSSFVCAFPDDVSPDTHHDHSDGFLFLTWSFSVAFSFKKFDSRP
jgi:hypothetical protein